MSVITDTDPPAWLESDDEFEGVGAHRDNPRFDLQVALDDAGIEHLPSGPAAQKRAERVGLLTATATRLDGPDCSHYQTDAGPLDLKTVRALPTWWLAWKATQSTSGVDGSHKSVRPLAEAAGFTHKLLYHWLSSTTDPVAQAEHYLSTVGSFGLWGAMLDAEEAGITVAKCLAWCETVEDHLRRPCSVYSGLYVAGGTIWGSPELRQSRYGPRAFHVAAYVSEDNLRARMTGLGFIPDFPFHAWQFSSNGPVAGVTGRCDMNRIDKRSIYDAVCGLSATPQPTPIEEDEMSDKWVRRAPEPDGTVTNQVWQICITNGVTWGFHVGGPHDPGARNDVLSGLFYDPATLKEWDGAILDSLPSAPPATGGGTPPSPVTLRVSLTGEATPE